MPYVTHWGKSLNVFHLSGKCLIRDQCPIIGPVGVLLGGRAQSLEQPGHEALGRALSMFSV